MVCADEILGAIAELVKIVSGVGGSIAYDVPSTDLEGLTVIVLLAGRVVLSMGGKPDAREITDTLSAMGAMTANFGYICKCVT